MEKHKTIDYYNENADDYINSTVNVSFSNTQDRFLKYLNAGAYILDFGCGSGRDTKYFLDRGFKVDAIDGSEKLCKFASDYTGIKVKQVLFQNFTSPQKYDGIWACSSILHLSKKDLKPVLSELINALNPDGIIYTSFKYSDFEGERNGRFFTDFTEKSFAIFISDIKNIRIDSCWITSDVRPGRNEEKWLNLIMIKQNAN